MENRSAVFGEAARGDFNENEHQRATSEISASFNASNHACKKTPHLGGVELI
jgi:hypothetical protein